MNPDYCPFLTLPTELYNVVASHLPLQSLPTALRALALTTRQIYAIFQSLLYAKVIVKGEEPAFLVLVRILKDVKLGARVRELHILADLSPATRQTRNKSTVLALLRRVIKSGHLSQIHTFNLAMLPGWYADEDDREVRGYNRLPRQFWKDLSSHCPLVRHVIVDGIGDSFSDRWMNASGLYELEDFSNLSSLSLKFRPGCPRDTSAAILLRSVRKLTSSLHTLALFFSPTHAYAKEDATQVLKLTFPHLKSIELASFFLIDEHTPMDFWARHPGLEKILLHDIECRWFNEPLVYPDLLPNITHLKANYADICAMANHLSRLQFLSFNHSINNQIPYLLRSVLPKGLPHLKGLEVKFISYIEPDVVNFTGATWYETESGEFETTSVSRGAVRTLRKSYMRSIVRGAPNIKELCLQNMPQDPAKLVHLASTLSQLPWLERLYASCGPFRFAREIYQSELYNFVAGCRPLAEACPQLKSVTDVSRTSLLYLSAKVTRDAQGSVVDIIPSRHSVGMELLGGEINPFPYNS